jgi:hypothetical protein
MAEIQKHEERAHSLLSSSGSSRWMNCTPSARKEEHIPNTESPYALEGTLAHELAEIELKLYFKLISTDEYKKRLSTIEDNEYYAHDMPEFVDEYVSYCISRYVLFCTLYPSVEVSIEEKIDLTKYIPDGFGSNDFVLIADGHIEVIDLKYGRGVSVSAVDNSQLKLYGLGSVYKNRLSYRMEDVTLTVVQPRTYSISSFVINVDVLEEWADNEVVVKAKMAYNGEGELNPGEWCKFCKFKPKCRAIYEQNIKLAEKDFADLDELTEEEIREVFDKGDQIVSWINAVNAYVLDKLLKREKFEGFKLVKGRSTRKFKDVDKLTDRLKEKGFKEEDFMSEPKLLGITAIEKLVGKKVVEAEFSDFIFKTEPKPSLVKDTDKRDDYFSSVEDDFSTDETKAKQFENDLL